jgi:hypothetical protein
VKLFECHSESHEAIEWHLPSSYDRRPFEKGYMKKEAPLWVKYLSSPAPFWLWVAIHMVINPLDT